MKTRTAFFPAIVATAALLATGAVMADPYGQNENGPGGFRHGGPPSAERQLAWLHEQLDLTEDQSVELLPLLQSRQAAQEELRARVLEEMRPEMCAQKQATDADILEVLTPEQAERYLQLQEQRRSTTGDRRGRGPGPLNCEGYGG